MKEIKHIAYLLLPEMLFIAVFGIVISTGYSDSVSLSTSSFSYHSAEDLPASHFSTIHGVDHTIVYEKTETSEEEEETTSHISSVNSCGLESLVFASLFAVFVKGEFKPNLTKRYILFQTLKLDC